jgi:hypothetical protein
MVAPWRIAQGSQTLANISGPLLFTMALTVTVNRCTHHKAIWDYYPNIRSGYRIKGTVAPVAA